MIVVQKAEDKHLEDIKRLWKDLMLEHAEYEPFWEMSPDAQSNFDWWMSREIHNTESCVLVALDADRVIGYLGGRINEHPPVFRLTKHFLITDAIVEPDYRGKGAGTELVKALIEWTKNNDIIRIELGVAPKNTMGHKFWKKMGFEAYLIMMAKENQ